MTGVSVNLYAIQSYPCKVMLKEMNHWVFVFDSKIMARFLLMRSFENSNLFFVELMFKSFVRVRQEQILKISIFLFSTFSFPKWKKKNFKIFWSDDIWILTYGHLDFSPWPKENWKNNKLATLNAIYLLYVALRTHSDCSCDSLGWYLSENRYFVISFCFPD